MPESIIGLYDAYTENTLGSHKFNPYDKTWVRKVLKQIYETGDGGIRTEVSYVQDSNLRSPEHSTGHL